MVVSQYAEEGGGGKEARVRKKENMGTKNNGDNKLIYLYRADGHKDRMRTKRKLVHTKISVLQE